MLLINASNLYVGGGMQVGISVIEEFVAMDIKFIAAVSPAIFLQLSKSAKEKSIVIAKTPSGIINYASRKQLRKIVCEYKIDAVFTIFGPSYWNPKVKNHTVGFALPWLIYDVKDVFNTLNFIQKIKKILLKYLQPYYFKLNAKKIIVETDDAKEHLLKKISFESENVFVVPNTVNSHFTQKLYVDENIRARLPAKAKDEIWLLTISHNYPHKNLKVIYELLDILPERFKFILTLDDSFLEPISNKHRSRLILLGKVDIRECPTLYHFSDALFLPTLLECFSASLVEAGAMKKPIFTSRRSFNETICRDGAFYFDPLSANNIAETIINAFNEPDEIKNKCIRMFEIQDEIPNANERARKYLEIISK